MYTYKNICNLNLAMTLEVFGVNIIQTDLYFCIIAIAMYCHLKIQKDFQDLQ